MKKTIKADLVFTLLFLLFIINAIGQRQMENLNRGVVAVRTSSSQVFVSWRMLGTKYNQNASYNLYRGSTQIASNLSTTNLLNLAMR